MFEMMFIGHRIKAIKKSGLTIEANPFSGEDKNGNFWSLKQIVQAKKNREMNREWFIRNIKKIKKKFSQKEYIDLAADLGFHNFELSQIEFQSGL